MSLPCSGDSENSTRTNASFSLTFSFASARHIASGSFPSGKSFVWKEMSNDVITSSRMAFTRSKRGARSSAAHAATPQHPATRAETNLIFLISSFSLFQMAVGRRQNVAGRAFQARLSAFPPDSHSTYLLSALRKRNQHVSPADISSGKTSFSVFSSSPLFTFTTFAGNGRRKS